MKKLLLNKALGLITDETGALSKSKMFWNGVNGYMMLSGYNSYRDEGKSVVQSLGETAVDWALWPALGNLGFFAYTAAANAGAVVEGVENLGMQQRQFIRQSQNQMPFQAHTFVDGQQIYTMRQAGMALAERAKYQVQASTLGNEAQYIHR